MLFIVLLAMGGILLWGVPAIQGLQDHAEFQSMLTQVQQLNNELLALRDAGTARPISISMNQGTLTVEDGSRWVVTATADAAYSPIYFTKWQDDTGLLVKDLPAGPTTVTVDRAVGGTFTRLEEVTCGAGDCETGLAAAQLSGNTIRVQFKASTLLKAEAWIYDAGRIAYRMNSDSTSYQIFVEMGAIFTRQSEGLFLDASPRVKEPLFTITPPDASFLVRAFQIQGDAAVSGKGHHNVFAYLENNYGTTRGRPLISPAYTVRLQVDDSGTAAGVGTLEEGFCNHFLGVDDYTAAAACDSGDVSILYNPGVAIIYELNQAVVQASVQAS